MGAMNTVRCTERSSLVENSLGEANVIGKPLMMMMMMMIIVSSAKCFDDVLMR